MSIGEVSLYFLGSDPIPYIGLVPIDIFSKGSLKTYLQKINRAGA